MKINNLSFIFFMIVYVTSASIWELPYSGALRWIAIGLLLSVGVISGLKYDGKTIAFCKEMWLVVAAYAIGFIVSIDKEYFIVGTERMLSFFGLIVGLYSYFSIRGDNPERLKDGIRIFSIFLEILSVALTVFFFFANQEFGKYMGIYGNANYLAPIASTAFGASLIMLLIFPNSKTRLFHIFCMITSTFLVVATGSRGGLLTLLTYFLILPFILFPSGLQKNFLKKIALSFIIAFSLFKIMEQINIPAFNRLMGAKDYYDSTGYTRGRLWLNGLEIFKVHPIVGWGNSATYYYTFVHNSSNFADWGVHSSYIMMIIDYGIIGTLFIFLFFVLFFSNRIVAFNRYLDCISIKDRRLFVLLIAICFSLLINATAESFLFSVGNFASVCFWLCLVFIDLLLISFRRAGGI